jgi:hypothetical protein
MPQPPEVCLAVEHKRRKRCRNLASDCRGQFLKHGCGPFLREFFISQLHCALIVLQAGNVGDCAMEGRKTRLC